MSVAGVSSSSALNPSHLQSLFQQRRSDFQQLSKALQSGDLAGAQAAFDALSNLGQNASSSTSSSTATSGPFRNSKLAQDFNNLGQALQSGDLAGAQQAFATLQQDIKASRHHFAGRTSQTPNPAPTTNSTPEIIINLGNAGSNGEQIIINFGAANGSSAAASTTPTPAPASSDATSSQTSSSTPSSSSDTSGSGSTSSTTTVAPTQTSAPEQIILNLNNGNNGPESITLNIGPGKSGEEITINVGKLSGGTQAPPNGLEINVQA